jgi:hypothetical protein
MNNNDYPFTQVLEEADKLIESGNGLVKLYQKFTCESCKGRLTMEEPNTFYTSGKCDRCGSVTNIKKNGCNYLVVAEGKGIKNVFDPLG